MIHLIVTNNMEKHFKDIYGIAVGFIVAAIGGYYNTDIAIGCGLGIAGWNIGEITYKPIEKWMYKRFLK